MSGHDRRPKEAAQLGAYFSMLTGKTGYFIDQRGQRRTIEDVAGGETAGGLRMGIVTFCPDGTWAMHEVDTDEAVTAYELALQMRHQSKVSTLYAGRAVKSEPYDGNAQIMEAIGNIPADAPELRTLMAAWERANMPRASEGKVPPERFGEAMALIHAHAGQYQPFPEPPEAEANITHDEHSELCRRLGAIRPQDLRAQVAEQGAHLPSLTGPALTVTEAADWDRLLTVAEDAYHRRLAEVTDLVGLLADENVPATVFRTPPEAWTATQLELAAAVWKARNENHVDFLGDVLCVNVVAAENHQKASGGKRAVVAEAKRKAELYGIAPVPSKWDDLLGHPVLYAAVVAA